MNAKEFFAALFDLAFERFVTIQLTGLVYALALAVGASTPSSPWWGPLRPPRASASSPSSSSLPSGSSSTPSPSGWARGPGLLIRIAENTREIRDALRKEKA